MSAIRVITTVLVTAAVTGCMQAQEPAAPQEPPAPPTEASITEASKSAVPAGPWPSGDQVGMANTLGAGTWMRCAHYMTEPGAKSYELSHVRSNDMTQSPLPSAR